MTRMLVLERETAISTISAFHEVTNQTYSKYIAGAIHNKTILAKRFTSRTSQNDSKKYPLTSKALCRYESCDQNMHPVLL